MARTNSMYTLLGKRTHRFRDIPGNATTNPINIDRKAANTDNLIVAEKPLKRNFILFHPFCVEGSITYQPHVPGGDEHPLATKSKVIAIKVFGLITFLSVL